MSTVVIIDDTQTTIQTIASIFRETDWEIEAFQDSDEALIRLNDEKAVPVDLVISDILMDDHIDGITLSRRLEGKFPVVLITGDDELQKEATSYGMPCMLKSQDNIKSKIWNFYHMAKKKFKADRSAIKIQESVNELQSSQSEMKHDLREITSNFTLLSKSMVELTETLKINQCAESNCIQKENIEEIKEEIKKCTISSTEHFNKFFQSFLFHGSKSYFVIISGILLSSVIGTMGYFVNLEYKDYKQTNISTKNLGTNIHKYLPKK